MRPIRLPLALLALWPALSPAQVRVEALRSDGEALRGELLEAWPELRLETPEGRVTLAWSALLEVRPIAPGATSTPASPPGGADWWFATADGSRFAGRLVEADGRAGRVSLVDGQHVSISLDALLWMRAAGQPEPPEWADGDSGRDDVAYVRRDGGDSLAVRGAVRGLTSAHLVFERGDKQLAIAWGKLAAVRFAPPAPRGSSVRIHARDGQVFAGALSSADARGVRLRSSLAADLGLAWAGIERIELAGGDVVFLSRLRPARYEHEPLLGKRWTYAIDRGLDGAPIVLGGRECATGIVMHSRSLLSFRVDRRFRQFAARVGIVDAMQQRGDARVQVVGDGRVLWEAESIRGGQPPRDVLVDIQGVQELLLVVDYGEDLELSDQVAWGLPRLLK